PSNDERYQSEYIDIAHGQDQANHIVSPTTHDLSTYALIGPFATGFSPVRDDYTSELYVDDTKIRYRYSGAYFNYSNPSTRNIAERKFKTNIYLTNIALPK